MAAERHQGGCHCGGIRFEVEGDIGQVIDCNCSLCRKRGGLLWFVPRAQFHLKTPEADLATYTFNTHQIRHHFCRVCGIAPFGEGRDPKGGEMAAVNARCLEDVDLGALTIVPFDGRSR